MKPADMVAITMARKLADAGLSVRLYLWRGEWTVVAVDGERQAGFGFRVTMADLLTNPIGFADLHARRLSEALTPRQAEPIDLTEP